jgi:capsid protein
MLAVLRHIAAGLNIPYELLVKDFQQDELQLRARGAAGSVALFQRPPPLALDYWLKPIYELWLEEAVNAGEVIAPDFYANRYAYTRCRFIFGGKGWVDPVKEAQAAVLRVAAGVSTLEQECAEQGLDYEEVLDQRMIERQMMIDRGLNPDGATAATAGAAVAKSLADGEGTEEEGGTNTAKADANALESSLNMIKEGALA